MRRIILLLTLLPSFAYAQAVKQNEAQASIYPTALQSGPHSSVDRYGNQMCSLQAGAAAATNPVKLEDTAHTSGDAGIPAFGIRNEGPTSFADSNFDYSPIAVSRFGGVFGSIENNFQISQALGILKLEDLTAASGDAGVAVFSKLQSALTVDAADGDYGTLKGDLAGRIQAGRAPLGETAKGCNSAVTTAATSQIFAGTASKYSAVTSWDCTNTGGAATRVILEDADGNDLANGFLAAASGYFSASFPDIPAYSTAVNKAIQVNVITTGSSTICCARGYYTAN